MEHVAGLSSVNSPNRSKPLVLVVDDDRSLQMLLTVAIEQEGIDTVQASSGEQCLHDYQRLRPDMILLDAVMPGMDGFECCRQLRQHSRAVPILMITVLDSPEYVEQAFQAGATDYITKPIQWAVLSHRVHRLLEAYQNVQKTELTLQALQRHQTWEQIQIQLLQNLRAKSLEQFLEFSLNKLHQFLNCDRALLFQVSTQAWLDIADEDQALPELQLAETKDVSVALTKENLSHPSWFSGSADELLQPLHQDICKKLQFQALCLYPIILDDALQAVLLVGHHHSHHQWLTFEQSSIQTTAEFITLAFQLQKSLLKTA